jgi:molecular chaperone DnaK (HSP70)
MKAVIGIDFGTAFSSVAFFANPGVQVISILGQRNTASVVLLDAQGKSLVGNLARKKAGNNPERVIYDSKRMLGRRFSDQEIMDSRRLWSFGVEAGPNDGIVIKIPGQPRTWAPYEICAMILRYLRDQAASALRATEIHAVIGMPAYFDASAEEDLRRAAEAAGITVLRLLSEPAAAAIGTRFRERFVHRPVRTVVVFDLRGGTLDLALLTVENNNFKRVATERDPHLGGRDFDDCLMNWAIDRFKTQHGVDLRENAEAKLRLLMECEERKKDLSEAENTSIDIPYICQSKAKDEMLSLSEDFSRDLFEDLCEDLFARCRTVVRRLLEHLFDGTHCRTHEQAAAKVDEVIMVGGGTHIPRIKRLLEEIFPGKVHKDASPEEAVVTGLAVTAAKLADCGPDIEEVRDTVFDDICPLSYGILIQGDIVDYLIMKGRKLPVTTKRQFQTALNYQRSIQISVYEGVSQLSEHSRNMNSYTIDLPGTQEAGEPVFVTFTLGEEHQLSLTAEIVKFGKRIQRVVTRERSLTVGPSLGDMLLAAENQSGRQQEEIEVDRRRRSSKIRNLEENVREYISRHSSDPVFERHCPRCKQTMLLDRLRSMLPTGTKTPKWEEIGEAATATRDFFRGYCNAIEKEIPSWI